MAKSSFEKGLDEVCASRGVSPAGAEPPSRSAKPLLLLCKFRVRWERMGEGGVQALLIASKFRGEKGLGRFVGSLAPLAMEK